MCKCVGVLLHPGRVPQWHLLNHMHCSVTLQWSRYLFRRLVLARGQRPHIEAECHICDAYTQAVDDDEEDSDDEDMPPLETAK